MPRRGPQVPKDGGPFSAIGHEKGWFVGGSETSEVVLCPILYCIDVFSTYLGEILDFVVVHWSFIFVSHVSRLIVHNCP